MERYRIVRMYANVDHHTTGRGTYYPKRTVKSGLTLEEAQAHCKDPETSSSTCKSSKARARTAQRGAWFDGYEKE